jgi:hypothetical protein
LGHEFTNGQWPAIYKTLIHDMEQPSQKINNSRNQFKCAGSMIAICNDNSRTETVSSVAIGESGQYFINKMTTSIMFVPTSNLGPTRESQMCFPN